jgi:hypothetical protein
MSNPLVRLDQMMARVVEQAYDDVIQAVSREEGSGTALAQALVRAKQLVTRLDIIAQWASLKWEATVQCARVLSACDEEEHALLAAADQLAYLHSELLHTKTPLFDVCTAYKVLAERDAIGLLPQGLWSETEIDVRAIRGNSDVSGSLERMMYLLRARVAAEHRREQASVAASGVGQDGRRRGAYGVRFDEARGSVVLFAHEGLYEVEMCLVPAPGVDVVLAKWRLAEAARREQERADLQDDAGIRVAAMEVDGGGSQGSPDHGAGEDDAKHVDRADEEVDPELIEACASKREFQWRWRILSVKLLPAMASTTTRVSAAALQVLGQQMEERLWTFADHQVLRELGLAEKDGGEHSGMNDADGDRNARDPTDDAEGTTRTATATTKDLAGTSALDLVDVRLRSLSSHVLIGVVVADAARALESGTWEGAMKVGKPPESNGIRIDLWCGIPVVSKEESRMLESSDVFEDGVEFDPRPHHASFEILLDLAGTLTPRCSPDTIPLTGEERGDGRHIISQLCSSDSGDGSNNLDRLLLRLTACLASSQLGCIRSSMVRQLETFGNLAVHTSIIYLDNNADDSDVGPEVRTLTGVTADGSNPRSEAPRIDLVSCGETVVSVTTNLKTGIPLFMLGSSIVEDGLVFNGARNAVRGANALLKDEIRGLKTRVLPRNASASLFLSSMVAKHALNLCAELVSFVSVRHLLAKSPFEKLTACERTPGMLIDADKHTTCYRLDGDDDSVGFLVLQTDFGVLGLQRARLCVYDKAMLRELRVLEMEQLSGWQDVLKEAKRELSGNKRGRGATPGYVNLGEEMNERVAAALLKFEDHILHSLS